jgi:hypothetical protein
MFRQRAWVRCTQIYFQRYRRRAAMLDRLTFYCKLPLFQCQTLACRIFAAQGQVSAKH